LSSGDRRGRAGFRSLFVILPRAHLADCGITGPSTDELWWSKEQNRHGRVKHAVLLFPGRGGVAQASPPGRIRGGLKAEMQPFSHISPIARRKFTLCKEIPRIDGSDQAETAGGMSPHLPPPSGLSRESASSEV